MALIDTIMLFNKAYDMARPVEYYLDCNERVIALSDLAKLLDNMPTIEPERKKGKWIHGRELSREMIGDAVMAIFYEGWECSECHCLVSEEREPLWKYCPNCGADMRGEQDEQTD